MRLPSYKEPPAMACSPRDGYHACGSTLCNARDVRNAALGKKYEIFDESHGGLAGLVASKEEGLFRPLNELGLFLPQPADGPDRLWLFRHLSTMQKKQKIINCKQNWTYFPSSRSPQSQFCT